MIILHYSRIERNNTSGESVIVPQIMNAQATFARIGFYNYGTDSFDTVEGVTRISDSHKGDDYRKFPSPFNKPDLVVFHSPFGVPRCAIICQWLKKDGIPYVIVPHGCFSGFAMKKKSLKKNVARLVFMDRVVRNAARMQYLSVGEKKASVYNTDCFVVPNGVFVSECPQKEKKEVLEISFIGRKDIYHKGLDFLVEACKIAKEQLNGRVRVNIYGPEYNNATVSLTRLIEECEVEDFVFNLPAVFGEEKGKVYAKTDVFVHTSRFEGQPVSILEAWSNGVPTLVTPGTNVAEECVENGCGWSVAQDANAIAEMLIHLVNNREEIGENAKNAYSYVRRMYSWENVADLYRAEYQKIVNPNKP